MEVMHPRCAGLDVHSRCVNACVRIAAGRKATTEHREFATTTAGLHALAAWLTEAGCTHVAMEATGVYWKPVWHILEAAESFTLVLANAQHIRNVPGAHLGNAKPSGITPITVAGVALTLTTRPTASGSAPYLPVQMPYPSITTGGAPGRSSSGRKSRPSSGSMPSRRKAFAVTWAPEILSVAIPGSPTFIVGSR